MEADDMDKFIKTTNENLSGLEKAAILLAEIGPSDNSNYDALFEALHLSADEIKKLRRAMKKLGRYAPARTNYEDGMKQIQREQSVLKEALAFGKRKGIASNISESKRIERIVDQKETSKIQKLVAENPDNVAKVIRSWLDK